LAWVRRPETCCPSILESLWIHCSNSGEEI
jgi:hypothetical protein